MDWDRVIERNTDALKRVLAMLLAMAAPADGGRNTLPRRLHRAILRLLRPAEAAARRLIVVAARGLVVTLPPLRQRKPGQKPRQAVRRARGAAIVPPPAARPLRSPGLPLADPLSVPGPGRPRYVPAQLAPRISCPGETVRHRLPPPLSPDDPIDATRLRLRLAAVASALGDLPKQALRLARWRARRARDRLQGRAGRTSPLRPGRAPGWRRKPVHEVDDVLKDLHHFARAALAPPDTS